MDPSNHKTLPASDAPRWQVSLLDLFSALTLVSVLLALTHWLSFGFATDRAYQTSLRVGLPAGATLLVCTLSYWYARWRGGPLLYWLPLRTTFARWRVLMWIPFAVGLAVFLAGLMTAKGGSAAPTALAVMWVFGTGSVVNLLFGSLRLQENGIVRSPGLVWVLSSWPESRQLHFRFDEQGNLVTGHSWSRVVATVQPGQHAILAGLLNRKLGLMETTPADESKSDDEAK